MSAFDGELYPSTVHSEEARQVVKRPYLKKGTGLSRFFKTPTQSPRTAVVKRKPHPSHQQDRSLSVIPMDKPSSERQGGQVQVSKLPVSIKSTRNIATPKPQQEAPRVRTMTYNPSSDPTHHHEVDAKLPAPDSCTEMDDQLFEVPEECLANYDSPSQPRHNFLLPDFNDRGDSSLRGFDFFSLANPISLEEPLGLSLKTSEKYNRSTDICYDNFEVPVEVGGYQSPPITDKSKNGISCPKSIVPKLERTDEIPNTGSPEKEQQPSLQNPLVVQQIHPMLMHQLQNLMDQLKLERQHWSEKHLTLSTSIELLRSEMQYFKEKLKNQELQAKSMTTTIESTINVQTSQFKADTDSIRARIKEFEDSHESILKKIEELEDIESKRAEETHDNKVIRTTLATGDIETVYANGTKELVKADGSETRQTYQNGDVRTVAADGTVAYFYAQSSTWHTTYPNGIELFKYSNGTTERRLPNGIVEKTVPEIHQLTPRPAVPNAIASEVASPRPGQGRTASNGSALAPGEKLVVFETGEEEIHGPDYRRRIFPDGAVKTVYNDGSQETRYPNGRIRIKDAAGNLVADVTLAAAPGLQPPA